MSKDLAQRQCGLYLPHAERMAQNMTDGPGPFNHWCGKNLTDYQRSCIPNTRRLFCMYYRKEGIIPREAAEAQLLQEYGHLKDEDCEVWRQSNLVLAERLSNLRWLTK